MDSEQLSMLVIFGGIVLVTAALIVASPLPRRARETVPSVARAERRDDDVSTWMLLRLAALVAVYAIIKGVWSLRRR